LSARRGARACAQPRGGGGGGRGGAGPRRLGGGSQATAYSRASGRGKGRGGGGGNGHTVGRAVGGKVGEGGAAPHAHADPPERLAPQSLATRSWTGTSLSSSRASLPPATPRRPLPRTLPPLLSLQIRKRSGRVDELLFRSTLRSTLWWAACPLSTGRGTRRVQLVREGGERGALDPLVGDAAPVNNRPVPLRRALRRRLSPASTSLSRRAPLPTGPRPSTSRRHGHPP